MGRFKFILALTLLLVSVSAVVSALGLLSSMRDNWGLALAGFGMLGILVGVYASSIINLFVARRLQRRASAIQKHEQRTGRLILKLSKNQVTLDDLISENGPIGRSLLDGRIEMHALSEAALENAVSIRHAVERRFSRFDDLTTRNNQAILSIQQQLVELKSHQTRLEEIVLAVDREVRVVQERVHAVGAVEPSFELRQVARSESDLLFGQLQSLLRIYNQLEFGGMPPSLGGWAIRADLAALLVELVLYDERTSVMEVGSGASTVLLAAALRQAGCGHVVAVEHLAEFAETTRDQLDRLGLGDWATVSVAPLVATDVGGETYLWYDLSSVDVPEQIDLLLVDGPPGTIGTQARYPAVPLLIDRFTKGSVVLLDDVNRADEQQIGQRWSELIVGEARYIDHQTGTLRLDFDRPRSSK